MEISVSKVAFIARATWIAHRLCENVPSLKMGLVLLWSQWAAMHRSVHSTAATAAVTWFVRQVWKSARKLAKERVPLGVMQKCVIAIQRPPQRDQASIPYLLIAFQRLALTLSLSVLWEHLWSLCKCWNSNACGKCLIHYTIAIIKGSRYANIHIVKSLVLLFIGKDDS